MKTRLQKDSWLLTTPIIHRGYVTGETPENSLGAFQKAIELGHPIEFDVQMTSDGHLVCVHDDNLKRLTGFDGDVRKTDYKTVKSLRILNTEEIIPDFKEVLNLVNGQVPLLIEIKHQLNDGICEKVVDELKNYKGEFALESFNPTYMKKFKKLAPEFLRGQLGTVFKSGLGFFIDMAMKYLPLNFLVKPDFICYNVKNLPISRLISNNLPIIAYTVNTEEEKTISKKYAVNYIFDNKKQ